MFRWRCCWPSRDAVDPHGSGDEGEPGGDEESVRLPELPRLLTRGHESTASSVKHDVEEKEAVLAKGPPAPEGQHSRRDLEPGSPRKILAKPEAQPARKERPRLAFLGRPLDLSGSWRMVEPYSARTCCGLGTTIFRIGQRGTAVNMLTEGPERSYRREFKPDGEERAELDALGKVQLTASHWERGRLIVETRRPDGEVLPLIHIYTDKVSFGSRGQEPRLVIEHWRDDLLLDVICARKRAVDWD